MRAAHPRAGTDGGRRTACGPAATTDWHATSHSNQRVPRGGVTLCHEQTSKKCSNGSSVMLRGNGPQPRYKSPGTTTEGLKALPTGPANVVTAKTPLHAWQHRHRHRQARGSKRCKRQLPFNTGRVSWEKQNERRKDAGRAAPRSALTWPWHSAFSTAQPQTTPQHRCATRLCMPPAGTQPPSQPSTARCMHASNSEWRHTLEHAHAVVRRSQAQPAPEPTPPRPYLAAKYFVSGMRLKHACKHSKHNL